jgi:hypothetical protein
MLQTLTASDIENDEIAIEIWDDDLLLGEIRKIKDELRFFIYPKPNGEPWNLLLNQFNDVLKVATKSAQIE